jgi:uncharacterized Zn finger protein (UPF0148 family)
MKCIVCGVPIFEHEGDNLADSLCIGCDIESVMDSDDDPHGFRNDPFDLDEEDF